jgi:hypothetical protein
MVMGSCFSGEGPVAGLCEHNSETPDSITGLGLDY